jgi:hypothetical protein
LESLKNEGFIKPAEAASTKDNLAEEVNSTLGTVKPPYLPAFASVLKLY